MGYKFLILGGDNRFAYLANILASEGHETRVYSMESSLLIDKVCKPSCLKDAIEGVDIVIGSLPLSQDDETVNCSGCDEVVYLKDVFKLMDKNMIFFGGFVNSKVHQLANAYNIHIYDYFEREELMIQNCIPTAEGAIMIAMQELPFTLYDSKCLILGYGRIGKILSKMLYALGSKVSVEARKHSDLAWIQSCGYEAVHLNNLEGYISNFDVIFNTIPSLILNEKLLKEVKKDCLIIDLASKPGGVDFEAAKEFEIKTIWALSLPGKVAPYTAAKIIKSTIFNYLEELGV